MVKLENPIIRYSANGEEILIKEKIVLSFKHENREYFEDFYVLSNARREKIIIGRRWMKRNWLQQSPVFECEIIAEPGKTVVEPTYQVPRKMEIGTKVALEKLFNQGYIRNSGPVGLII